MNLAYARFTRGAGISAFATASFYLRNICLLPILTRYFGVEDYGVWVQIIGVVELLSGVATLKLSNGLQRFLPSRREAGLLADDVMSILLIVGLTAATLSFVIVTGVDAWGLLPAGDANGGIIRYAVFALVPVSALFQVLVGYFRASQQTGRYSLFLIVESFGYLGLALLALWLGAGLWGVVGALSFVRLVSCIAAFTLMVRQIGLSRPSFSCLPTYLRFCLPFLPMAVFVWINGLGDRYVIALILGPEATGVYSVSYAIANIAGLLFAPIFFVFAPAITPLWEKGDLSSVKELLLYAQKYPFLFVGPLVIILTFYNKWIIATFATSQYLADPVLALMISGGIVFMNISTFAESFIALLNKTQMLPVIWGAGAALNVTANLIVVPIWGINGAAMTTLLTFVFQAAFSFFYVRQFYPIRYNHAMFLKCMVASLLMASVIYPFRNESNPIQAMSFLAGGLCYLLCLVLLKSFERRELVFFRRLIASKGAVV